MRYAIYFTPATDTGLWHFGSSALGYDAAACERVAFPAHSLWNETWFTRALEDPARYGFHATLKAPFSLTPGATEDELLERAAAFAGQEAPVLLPALRVTPLEGFVALRPLVEDPELDRLAASCVRSFDELRAPLSDVDRERRLSQELTQRQRAHLERWGYPYVLGDFRFHMTLTGAMPKSLVSSTVETLTALYHRVNAPVSVDAISVLSQPTRESRFSVIARFRLRGAIPLVNLFR